MKFYFHPIKSCNISYDSSSTKLFCVTVQLIQSNADQMSEWNILLAKWIVLTMLIVFDYGNPIVSGGVIALSVLLHGYAWMNRGHCTSKDFMRRKRGPNIQLWINILKWCIFICDGIASVNRIVSFVPHDTI